MKNVKLNWIEQREKGTSILVHSRASQLPVEESDVSLREVVGVGRWCFGKSMPATVAEELQLRRWVCYVALNWRLPNVRCLCVLPTDDNKPIDFVIIIK